jgi:hypothetical protein
MTMTLHVGGAEGSRVTLPVVTPDGPGREWPTPEVGQAPPGVGSSDDLLPVRWTVEREGSRAVARWEGRSAAWFPWGRQEFMERLALEADDEDPAHASVRGEAETVVALGRRTLTWQSDLQIDSDVSDFHYRCHRQLLEDGQRIRERAWEESIPRDHQ